jgi:hypothetical protein
MKVKVIADPACNVNYASFYVEGLRRVFGRRNIVWRRRPFESLRYSLDCHCLAFIVNGRRYVADFADSNSLFFPEFLKWADVYGKVNYCRDCRPADYAEKIVAIGPNFGIANFGSNRWTATLRCLMMWPLVHGRINYNYGSYLSPYLWLYKRHGIKWAPDIDVPETTSVFMVARWWRGQTWVNSARVNFIRACRRLDAEGLITFVGGLVTDQDDDVDCPIDVHLADEIPMNEYVEGMKHSMLVFNTPSYHHCHGWRLPEYLSQGKVILSTPFVNELPVALTHKKDIYFAKADEQSLYEAIKELALDASLRSELRAGSRRYWEQYACPEACVRRFIEN